MIKAVLFDFGGVISKGGKFGRAPMSISGVHKDIYDISKNLRNKGYLVGVLSNVKPKAARRIKKKGLYEGFCPVLLSCEVNMKKPNEAIFKHALAILGLKPEQVLFIDNSKRHVKTAGKVGMSTIRVKNHKRLIADITERFPELSTPQASTK